MRRGIFGYIGGRVCVAMALLTALSLIVYVGTDLLPGDPASNRLGAQGPEAVADARRRLGLDEPLLQRYLDWVGGLLGGDLGTSASGTPVVELLQGRLANSMLLAGLAVALVVPLSLVVGITLARHAGRRAEAATSSLLILTLAIPDFILASLLVVVFAVGLGWLPAVSLVPAGSSPMVDPAILVLPVTALVLVTLAYATRIIRAAGTTAMSATHVEFMRLNGIRERTILRQAVLPAVLPAATQVWLLSAAALFGGTVLVERVFSYPGVGEVLATSVRGGDLAVVQALAMLMGAVTLMAMIAADVVGRLLDPRARP